MSHELTPAYGQDYKSAREVIAAFNEGKDFEGGYDLGFRYINKAQIAPGTRVLLRYRGNRMVASTIVKA